jgi:hypothetical protein
MALLAEIEGECRVALEATYGWEVLADALQDAGYELHLAHLLRTASRSRGCVRRDKIRVAAILVMNGITRPYSDLNGPAGTQIVEPTRSSTWWWTMVSVGASNRRVRRVADGAGSPAPQDAYSSVAAARVPDGPPPRPRRARPPAHCSRP